MIRQWSESVVRGSLLIVLVLIVRFLFGRESRARFGSPFFLPAQPAFRWQRLRTRTSAIEAGTSPLAPPHWQLTTDTDNCLIPSRVRDSSARSLCHSVDRAARYGSV